MKVNILKVYGTQADIVQTSRVCTGKEELGQTPATTAQRIADLIKKKHWSPFQFATIVVEIDAPIYVMRQWMRHSGSWMEKSRRYTKDTPQFGELKSVGFDKYDCPEYGMEIIEEYNLRLIEGATPEDARKILPLDLMTKVWWHVDLRDLMSFFRQRLDPHAQKEIRELATDLMCQTYKHFPDVVANFLTEDFGEVQVGVDTTFDLYMLQEHGAYAYEGSQKRITKWGEDAKRKLEYIKGLFDRIAETVPDGSDDSGSPSMSCTDGEEVCKDIPDPAEVGETEGRDAERFVRGVVEDEQEATFKLGKRDCDDVQMQLPFGEEPFIQTKEADPSVTEDETLVEIIEPNIVVGRFGSVHSGQSV